MGPASARPTVRSEEKGNVRVTATGVLAVRPSRGSQPHQWEQKGSSSHQ